MSEADLAATDEREACAKECDETAARFRQLAAELGASHISLDAMVGMRIAEAQAGVAEALGRIIRARTGI